MSKANNFACRTEQQFPSRMVNFSCILLFSFMPESPRWLAVRGKREEAKKGLERIASTNKRQLPVDLLLSDKVRRQREQKLGLLDGF